MLGLLEPSEGEILVDGVNLKNYNTKDWRNQIGIVMQGSSLLKGTIGQNISFFDPDIDNDRVYSAARQANIHEEIMAMPMEYSSLSGDMGSALSGGQQQRILLARALYKNPKILFLDEGTANLDNDNAEIIASTIRELSITRIVIAHSQELPKRADRILTIDI